MRTGTLAQKSLSLGAALLLTLSLSFSAKAEETPTADSSLDFDADGAAMMDGKEFQEGAAAERSADVYADVVKVVDGPEDSAVLYLRPIEARRKLNDGTIEKMPVSSAEPRPFMPEPGWKMFNAEGEETSDPRFAIRVIMPFESDLSSAMFEVKWNECEGPISGNYVGFACNNHRHLSDDYMVFLKKNLIPCVNDGLKAAGLGPTTKVHIQHDGTSADENHSGGSLHSAGRAIDIMQVIITYPGNKKSTFDFTKTNPNHKLSKNCAPAGTANCKFFEAFRSCWHKLHVARKCRARREGPIGTLGWEDRKHIAHHLHTSYPFCPNSKGYFITKQP